MPETGPHDMMDNKNFIIAIVLSLAILIGWQYFFAPAPPPAAGRRGARHPRRNRDADRSRRSRRQRWTAP